MSYSFVYYTPTKIVFGEDAEAQTGALTAACKATKVLLLYGGGSAKRSGLLDRVAGSLQSAGVAHVALGGVQPNPRLSLVREGIALCRREGVDFVLAVGGGSVIDTAKAIAYGVANEGDVWDFYEHTRTAVACLPVGVVLTIAAAGSEMSCGSVITKDEGGVKRAYDDDLCRPRFAVMNPRLTMNLPAYQTACGCADIMMHTMERYFTNGGNMEVTDSLAEGLMRTVITYARVLKRAPQDDRARAEIMWAGSLSHNGLTGCGNDGGDFATHMLEHELSGLYNVAHGAGLAAVWGSWARYVMRDCLPRFVRFSQNVMGAPRQSSEELTALLGIEMLEAFFREIGMPTSLSALGLSPTDGELRLMARKCSAACGGSCGSAKVLQEADMYAIYAIAR